MEKEYIVYRCRTCKKYIILVACEVQEAERENRFITCPYHAAHRNLKEVEEFDDLKEVIKTINCKDTYKKVGSKVVQKGWSKDV